MRKEVHTMSQRISEVINPIEDTYNLSNYEEIRHAYDWHQAGEDLRFRETGKVNIAYETIDRHVEDGYGDKVALHYVDGETRTSMTFREVKERTDHYSRILRSNGVKKGERVFIFLPKTPECYISILAAIKIGAIAGPLFEAFMEDAVRDRINDCRGTLLITNREMVSRVPQNDIPSLETILYAEDIEAAPVENGGEQVEWVDLEDGMLIHYTSGSTGKPKGVLHAHRVMTHQYESGKWVLDIRDDDVYWCTSHPGWVTGSVYGLFAPWLNRATIVIQGGRFKAENWYQLIADLKVTVWYSAPTAFRMLLSQGDVLKDYDLSSLRHILSVGEPLNPEVIYWAWERLGVRIHDTWWMTETGAHLIVNLPGEKIKPGSMGRPFPGIEVGILDEAGNELPRGCVGQLAVKTPWPGLMKEIWGNRDKFNSYFKYEGWYVSGDLAYQDDEGYVFFQSRDDDMINSAGERIGPFEVESKLIEHPAVQEAGVVGKPDPVRGELVKAFIVLREGYEQSDSLLEDIRIFVRNNLAAHSAPREIEVMEELPKTTISGKILRRELKRMEIERQKEAELKKV
jgi:acetyl-CoA synthetase